MAGEGGVLFRKEGVLVGNVGKGKVVNWVGGGDSVVGGLVGGI